MGLHMMRLSICMLLFVDIDYKHVSADLWYSARDFENIINQIIFLHLHCNRKRNAVCACGAGVSMDNAVHLHFGAFIY